MTSPYYQDDAVTLYHGDCIEVMRELPDASVDAVVTDPPYNLSFMGREWDSFGGGRAQGSRGGAGDRGILPGYGRGGTSEDRFAFRQKSSRAFGEWCEQWATECLRVLRPGGHLLAFGGSRTWHRLACAVEDAGFEMRDSIAWLYGSGFPKSMDVSKAIDKAAGATREVIAERSNRSSFDPLAEGGGGFTRGTIVESAPATDAAREWEGWGTALKPAFEPIVVGRKPLIGTVAANVLAYGTGALNIDGCRVGDGGGTTKGNPPKGESNGIYGNGINGACDIVDLGKGRWPTNVVLDPAAAAEMDRQSGESVSKSGGGSGTHFSAGEPGVPTPERPRGGHDDTGGASRFFPTFRYEAKAPTSERPRDGDTAHPTVKPLDLMRWLVRLVTPPGGTVLEPFAGSGTTAEACVIEGFKCIAIEREDTYLPLIVQRLTKPIQTALDLGGVA